jgi:integrase/recombinase XerD
MKTYIEPDEVTMIEKVASNLRDKILIRLLFRLGCRVSEALALKVEDIDFAHGTVTIKHLKSRLKLSCLSCGAKLGMSHSFCPKCGIKLDEAN